MHLHKQVYLGLGSNQNSPRKQLATAIYHVSRLPHTRLHQMAPWYETPPWGVTDQDNFINTVISILTKLTPLQLLKQLKHIEYRIMNRRPNKRWHSRCIDIDILYVPNQPFKRRNLSLPHPHMQDRNFVLRPLLDIKPLYLPRKTQRTLTVKRFSCQQLERLPIGLEKNKINHILAS